MTDLRAAIAVTLVPYSESSVPPTHGDVLDHGRAGKWIVTSIAAPPASEPPVTSMDYGMHDEPPAAPDDAALVERLRDAGAGEESGSHTHRAIFDAIDRIAALTAERDEQHRLAVKRWDDMCAYADRTTAAESALAAAPADDLVERARRAAPDAANGAFLRELADALAALRAERDALRLAVKDDAQWAQENERLTRERDEWKRKYGDANVWGLQNCAAWKDRAERAERDLAAATERAEGQPPREPTDAMISAGAGDGVAAQLVDIAGIWRAMYDAAPPAPASDPQAEPQPEAIPIAPVEVVRQALKELLESISECRMDQVTARFAKASVMARAVVDRYKDAT